MKAPPEDVPAGPGAVLTRTLTGALAKARPSPSHPAPGRSVEQVQLQQPLLLAAAPDHARAQIPQCANLTAHRFNRDRERERHSCSPRRAGQITVSQAL